MSYFKNRIRAFNFAFTGLYYAIKQEKNLQLQCIIAVIVIIGAFFCSITKMEWIMLLVCIAGVLSLELINSALEKLCDSYTTNYDDKIKYIKDVSAAAVLIFSFFSAIVGCIIFFPYIQHLFTKNI